MILVAHSGANVPVSLVLDQDPELVSRVIWDDSGPVADGGVFAPDLPDEVSELSLPLFAALAQQASLEGLSAEALEGFQTRAVPQPASVLGQPVELVNEARRCVPTTLVCCSIPGEQLMQLAQAGHPMSTEVTKLEHGDIVDLPTARWPRWSRPRDLAEVIRSAALQTS